MNEQNLIINETIATMFVFAGNNGSGKSTIRNLIVDRLGVSVNIDPDALSHKINNGHPQNSKVSAGKEALRRLENVEEISGRSKEQGFRNRYILCRTRGCSAWS